MNCDFLAQELGPHGPGATAVHFPGLYMLQIPNLLVASFVSFLALAGWAGGGGAGRFFSHGASGRPALGCGPFAGFGGTYAVLAWSLTEAAIGASFSK